MEANGTSIVDITDPARPVYLKHLEGQTGAGEAGGAQMVRTCSGDQLPKGIKGLTDVSTEAKLFNVSNFQVPESEGNYCSRGGRFGSHSSSENMTPIDYRRVVFFAWLNAGVRGVDIRDPFNPVEIAFYVPATTPDTDERCVTIGGVETCKTSTTAATSSSRSRQHRHAHPRAGG